MRIFGRILCCTGIVQATNPASLINWLVGTACIVIGAFLMEAPTGRREGE